MTEFSAVEKCFNDRIFITVSTLVDRAVRKVGKPIDDAKNLEAVEMIEGLVANFVLKIREEGAISTDRQDLWVGHAVQMVCRDVFSIEFRDSTQPPAVLN